ALDAADVSTLIAAIDEILRFYKTPGLRQLRNELVASSPRTAAPRHGQQPRRLDVVRGPGAAQADCPIAHRRGLVPAGARGDRAVRQEARHALLLRHALPTRLPRCWVP